MDLHEPNFVCWPKTFNSHIHAKSTAATASLYSFGQVPLGGQGGSRLPDPKCGWIGWTSLPIA